jgi:uncharacterized membrane protein YozB (DUF420 family)
MPAPTSILPAVNASLNGASAVLLAIGRWQIYRGRVAQHRAVMLTTVATSSVFLATYLWYHAHVGSVRYQHHGAARDFYLVLLATHTVLAAALMPLVLLTVSRALRNRFALHKKIARWTWPVWMYVSVTGVVVYWMLYHLDR